MVADIVMVADIGTVAWTVTWAGDMIIGIIIVGMASTTLTVIVFGPLTDNGYGVVNSNYDQNCTN